MENVSSTKNTTKQSTLNCSESTLGNLLQINWSSIEPIFNRAVIFTLSDKSVHGHPIPLKTPSNIERYSLALYYYIEQPNQEYYERRAVVWHDF